MNTIAEVGAVATKAPADEAEAKARLEALDGLTLAVARCVELWPHSYHRRLLVRVVADLSDELGYEIPYERIEEMEAEADQSDLEDVLREVRADIKRGDIEHALLQCRYQLGDY